MDEQIEIEQAEAVRDCARTALRGSEMNGRTDDMPDCEILVLG